MKHRIQQALWGLALALLSQAAQAANITVSAAASLSNALRDIAPLFEAAHPGAKLQLNFGASGALLQQIAKGAPADVFVSADQEAMDQADAQKLLKAGTRRNLVSNSLVLIVPAAAQPPKALAELAQPAYARIAIGLPASVPVGRYTKAVLEGAGLWAAVEPKVIGASSVRQALDYVARAEVDAGFVYATDAALMPDKVKTALVVPTTKPVLYPIAALAGAPNPADAAKFIDFLFTPPAQAVLLKYGFGKP
ncbi:molybdenum ABC transporter, periplasmic molybdate-binding protein [Burkholderiales bacterium JOSHI_001]|nr:molybdenum ABC transporter, periplasmic molybdate-binding protein [Burkholderiales bacterium JOSHI_001]